jgi:hypothetical protein
MSMSRRLSLAALALAALPIDHPWSSRSELDARVRRRRFDEFVVE